MSIATMEDLRSVQPGATVVVSGRQFAHEGEMWRWNQSLVPADFFTSEVAEGNVTRGPEFPAGQVRRDRDYDYWVMLRQTEDQVWLARATTADSGNTWTPEGFESRTVDEFRGLRMMPDQTWGTAMLPALMLGLNLHLSRPETPAVEPDTSAADEVRDTMCSALREYIDNHDGLTATEREDLLEVMRDNGMTVTRTVDVTIEVTGKSSLYMDSAMASAVGGDVSVDMPRVEVDWSRTFSHQVTTDGDPESVVTDALVRTLLTNAGVIFDSFEFEVTY